MSSRKISQRDARMYKKRVEQLESSLSRQNNVWAGDWPGGVHVATMELTPEMHSIVRTARLLGHAVVCVTKDGRQVYLYGVKL